MAERPQAEVKAELLVATLVSDGIDAMAPGAGELAFGTKLLTDATVPWVAANLRCPGVELPAFRDVTRGGHRWRLVGVTGPTAHAEGCTVTPAESAVRVAIEGVPDDVTVVVLSNQSVASDRTLAQALPAVDLIVNGQDRQQIDPPQAIGQGALLMSAGSRGKHLGRLDIAWTAGATRIADDGATRGLRENRARHARRIEELRRTAEGAPDASSRTRAEKLLAFTEGELSKAEAALTRAESGEGKVHRASHRLVPLDDTTVDHPRTLAAVQAAKAKIAALATAAAASAREGGGFDLAASPWIGSAACLACHVDAATQWSTTAHARALQSLRASNRAMDDACWSCHVTGAGKPGGPTRPGDLPQALEHVGCESCHGPGRAHAASPATVRLVRQPAVEVCTGCHDGVRDEGRFDARSYLAKVAHGARP